MNSESNRHMNKTTTQTTSFWARRSVRIALGLIIAVVAIAAFIFKPWLLFIDKQVDDAIPDVVASAVSHSATASPSSEAMDASPTASSSSTEKSSAPAAENTSPAVAEKTEAPEAPPAPSTEARKSGVQVVAQGNFISHEHETTGTASIVHNFDNGQNQLVLSNLSTSNGPDVHVWVSKAPVIPGTDGWFVAGSYERLDLGQIKGNKGNQVYALPETLNVADWTSIVLWCDDFSVSFGAAELVAQ